MEYNVPKTCKVIYRLVDVPNIRYKSGMFHRFIRCSPAISDFVDTEMRDPFIVQFRRIVLNGKLKLWYRLGLELEFYGELNLTI